MEPSHPDVIDQLPAGGSPNAPESGTYGEDAALQRLEQALPGMEPDRSQAMQPAPLQPGGPEPAGAVPGLPAGLLAPTTQPDVPVSTPLTQAQPIVVGPSQQRRQLLEVLSRSPEVSEETREWASLVLGLLG